MLLTESEYKIIPVLSLTSLKCNNYAFKSILSQSQPHQPCPKSDVTIRAGGWTEERQSRC